MDEKQQWNGFNAGCVDPDEFVTKLLAGEHPEYGFDKQLDSVIPIAGGSVTDFDIPKLDQTVPNFISQVLPRLYETNGTRIPYIVGQTDGAGNATINFNTSAVGRYLGYVLQVQVNPLNSVLTQITATETMDDGSGTSGNYSLATKQYTVNCNDSNRGVQVLRLFNNQIRTADGLSPSCNSSSGAVRAFGEATKITPGSPANVIVPTNQLVINTTPGANYQIYPLGQNAKCLQNARRNTNDVLAKANYRLYARLMANDMKKSM